MKKVVVAIILLFFVSQSYSVEAGKQIAGKFNDYSVSYVLPKTVVDIDVELEYTQFKAGPYANYSKKYLGIPAKVNTDSMSWELVGVKAKVTSVPDNDIYYSVQLKSGASPFIYIDNEGVLLSVNTQAEQCLQEDEIKEESLTSSPLDDNTYSLALTEEMLLSGSNIRMAELAAKQIYRLRESKTDIITGESDQKFDGEALKLMLQQIEEQEKRLTVMFTGTEQKQRKTLRIRWIPQRECEEEVVARISEQEGLVSSENLSGEPIYISLNNVVRATTPLDAKGNPIILPENSVIYNIPGEAQLSLSYKGETLFSKKVELTQFGIKFGLAHKLFIDKKQPAYMILHKNTGAIKEIGQKPIVE